MDALITLANPIYVLTYFVQDMLRLRVLTIVAASILIARSWAPPEPIMAVVYWNAFFILLIAWQAVRTLNRRRPRSDPCARPVQALRAWYRARLSRGPGRVNRCAVN
jgi:thiol:disulfide interchange protein